MTDFETRTTDCKTHGVADERGDLAAKLPVPPCNYINADYGAWSDQCGGFVYAECCALAVANQAAEEMAANPDDDFDYVIVRVCPDHQEERAEVCEPCAAEMDDEA